MERNIIKYEEAWSKASKQNKEILAKAEIGQEIVVAGGYCYDEYLHEVEFYKLGAKHPEIKEKLNNEEVFEFEEELLIYAGNGVCYYTGKSWGRRRCQPHYNKASVWIAL